MSYVLTFVRRKFIKKIRRLNRLFCEVGAQTRRLHLGIYAAMPASLFIILNLRSLSTTLQNLNVEMPSHLLYGKGIFSLHSNCNMLL